MALSKAYGGEILGVEKEMVKLGRSIGRFFFRRVALRFLIIIFITLLSFLQEAKQSFDETGCFSVLYPFLFSFQYLFFYGHCLLSLLLLLSRENWPAVTMTDFISLHKIHRLMPVNRSSLGDDAVRVVNTSVESRPWSAGFSYLPN